MQIGPHVTFAHSRKGPTLAQRPLPPTPVIWSPVFPWTLLLHPNRHPAKTLALASPRISTSPAKNSFVSFSRSPVTNSWKYGRRQHPPSPISLAQVTFSLRNEPSSLAATLTFELMPVSPKRQAAYHHGRSTTPRQIFDSFPPPCTIRHPRCNPLSPRGTYLSPPNVSRQPIVESRTLRSSYREGRVVCRQLQSTPSLSLPAHQMAVMWVRIKPRHTIHTPIRNLR